MAAVTLPPLGDLSGYLHPDIPTSLHNTALVSVKDKLIHCSGLILSARSSVFREILSHDNEVFLTEFADDVESVYECLKLLYGGSVVFTERNVFVMYKFGVLYKIDSLQSFVLDWLLDNIRLDSFWELFIKFQRYRTETSLNVFHSVANKFLAHTKSETEFVNSTVNALTSSEEFMDQRYITEFMFHKNTMKYLESSFGVFLIFFTPGDVTDDMKENIANVFLDCVDSRLDIIAEQNFDNKVLYQIFKSLQEIVSTNANYFKKLSSVQLKVLSRLPASSGTVATLPTLEDTASSHVQYPSTSAAREETMGPPDLQSPISKELEARDVLICEPELTRGKASANSGRPDPTPGGASSANRDSPVPASRNSEPVKHPVYNTEELWYYLDPKGDVQGPFNSVKLYAWYNQGFFDNDLHIRRSNESTFTKLETLIVQSGRIPFQPDHNTSPVPASQLNNTPTRNPPNADELAKAEIIRRELDQEMRKTKLFEEEAKRMKLENDRLEKERNIPQASTSLGSCATSSATSVTPSVSQDCSFLTTDIINNMSSNSMSKGNLLKFIENSNLPPYVAVEIGLAWIENHPSCQIATIKRILGKVAELPFEYYRDAVMRSVRNINSSIDLPSIFGCHPGCDSRYRYELLQCLSKDLAKKLFITRDVQLNLEKAGKFQYHDTLVPAFDYKPCDGHSINIVHWTMLYTFSTNPHFMDFDEVPFYSFVTRKSCGSNRDLTDIVNDLIDGRDKVPRIWLGYLIDKN